MQNLRILAFIVWLTTLAGCSDDSLPETMSVPPITELASELSNPDFRWFGPCSREDRIPVSHAARALAYIGDAAVPVLFRAAQDDDVRILDVYDALDEIGLPVLLYHDELMARDVSGLEQWWHENRLSTALDRSWHRETIGLPRIQQHPPATMKTK